MYWISKKAQRALNKRGWKKGDLFVKGQKLFLRLAKRVLSVKGDENYVLGCNINFACRLESWGPESPLNWQINVCLSLRPALTTRPAMMPNILGFAYFGARMITKHGIPTDIIWYSWPFSCDIILYECLLRFVFVICFRFWYLFRWQEPHHRPWRVPTHKEWALDPSNASP